MGETKVTIMVIKVDLQCEKCYKKIKRVLCKFPQIRDQIYDEKNNTVTIKVVCCSPEKIKMKIRCKGGDSVKGIEIVPEKKPEKPKEPEKPKPAPPPPERPTSPPPPRPIVAERPKAAEKAPQPVPPVAAFPIGVCCVECYGGRGGGPCYEGYGYPPRVYDGYHGTPVYDSWGGGGYPVSRCGENSSICSIM
ncbi:protein PYRICULARIA ORYZAE RESISTANCE 21-like [Tripterygium wilfordii]|uniref:protein PYRICULARIA ORYZAE RESISTANCE 21-like n=1 Tax=Tripterygium wilfordii TaxID=458696 RepID=UPI0018F82002|nr:protein PYRICULARIA ORYZAE RESISTANCE 21-like [Tripterygium wilfordii]